MLALPPSVTVVPDLVIGVLASPAAAQVDNAATNGAPGRLGGVWTRLDGSVIVIESVFHCAVSVVRSLLRATSFLVSNGVERGFSISQQVAVDRGQVAH